MANVQLLVKEGLAVDQADDYGLTPLIMASAIGSTPIVDYLIRQGANVNHPTHYGNTALMAAANQGDFASVKKLIDAGAQIDTENREGMTALAFAMDRKHSEIYQYLIEREASQETAMSILVKQLLYVKKMYPPKVQEITKKRQIGNDLGYFDPSHCKNPHDPYMYFAENRLVIKEKLPINYIEKLFKERYELAPLPKPLDPNAPAGCYENPMQKLNMEAYYFPLNIFYANDSVISLSKAERAEHCQYLPFSTLYCGPAKLYHRAYRVDRAIYSLPLNQPFVIYCENRGFSLGNLCTVYYKKGHHRIAYAVNPYDKNYSLTKALSIKEIIDKDKEKQYQLEANRIKNYPWQD